MCLMTWRQSFRRCRKSCRPRTSRTGPNVFVYALAVYAVPTSADDFMRRGSSDRPPFPQDFIAKAAVDAAVRERVEKLYQLTRARVRNHEKWFETFAERGRVVELSGAHHLFISSPREVLEQIDAFMSSLADRR